MKVMLQKPAMALFSTILTFSLRLLMTSQNKAPKKNNGSLWLWFETGIGVACHEFQV
jgi:hypothetical protein